MVRNVHTTFTPNPRFFETVLRQPKVEQKVDDVARSAQSIAKANAPVDSGDYRDGIGVEHHDSRYRRAARVVGTDEKTLLIESKTGNLARALKAAKP